MTQQQREEEIEEFRKLILGGKRGAIPPQWEDWLLTLITKVESAVREDERERARSIARSLGNESDHCGRVHYVKFIQALTK